MSKSNTTKEAGMKVQLPAVGDRYMAIQKIGGKIHASTSGRAICNNQLMGRIVIGECDASSICEKCSERISHISNTFPKAAQS